MIQSPAQGQAEGRWRCSRRAEVAIRAGTVMIWRRTVAVVARARFGPVVVAAARVRLNAMTAQTSHAALALNTPEGRWARAEALRSAWTFSITAWARWVWSAVTVSRMVVVKNAWNRQVWNRVAVSYTHLTLPTIYSV